MPFPLLGPTLDALVDRAAELKILAAAADQVEAGQPRIVLVSGPAGIGKSALVVHAMRLLTGFRRLDITADEVDTLVGYSALGQIASGPRRGTLATFPLLGSGPPAEATYLAVAAELVRLIGDVDPGRPTALVIEDAQWLDVPSARALQMAVRRLGVERALVVVTTRGGTRPADAGWLRLASTQDVGTHLPLGPLTPSGVAEMAVALRGRPLGPTAVRRLHEHTGGHPLHTRLLLEQLDWSSLASATGPFPVPPSMAEAVSARLAGVSPETRELVVAAAVLGGAPPLSRIASVGGVTAPAAALEEAVAAGLLTEVQGPGGRGVTIPHPLMADAVLDGIGPSRRAAAHGAALPHVAGEAVLRHRVAATQQPDEPLAAQLEATADEHDAAGRAEAAAAGYLAAAEVSADAAAAQHRFLRGVVLLLTAGDLVRAVGLAPRVHACAPGTERDSVLAILSIAMGRFADATAKAQAVGERAGRPEHTRTAAMIDLTSAAAKTAVGLGGHVEAAAVLANRAATPSWRRQATVLGAVAHGTAGRVGDGLALLADLPRAASQVATDDLPLLAARGGLRYWSGREEEALADLRGVRARVGRGEPIMFFLAFALGLLAETELAVGQWDSAQSEAELALAAAEAEGRPAAAPPAHSVLAQISAERGAVDQAAGHAAECRQWADAVPSPLNRVVAALAEAILARSAGRPAAMLDALAPLTEDEVPFRRAYWRVLHAQALLATGQVAEARRRADEFAGYPGRAGTEARLLQAEAALADLDVAAARRAAATLTAAVPAGRPFLAARADLVRGTVLLASGQPPAAVDALRRAYAGFEGLGAHPWATRCEQTLIRAGETTTVTDPVPDRLTRREREVAHLAASGLSNADTAARLCVSRKAVEFHLTNVYSKLGIGSRRQLASRLEAVRMMPPPTTARTDPGVRP